MINDERHRKKHTERTYFYRKDKKAMNSRRQKEKKYIKLRTKGGKKSEKECF